MSERELHELAARGRAMPRGLAQVETFELLARRADALNHAAFGVWARQLLYGAANGTGMYERMIDAYTWLRAAFEKDRTRVDRDGILQMGAHVVDCLDPFPEIPRAQIEALYEEQEALFRREGASLRPLHKARMSTALAMGRLDDATRAYEAWTAMPRDPLAGCEPCEQNSRFGYLVEVGRDEEALAVAAPLLDGTITCKTVPFSAPAWALLPLCRTGRVDEARRLHRKGTAEALTHFPWLRTGARFMTFGALDGAHEGALRLVEKMLPEALGSVSRLDPLILYVSILVLLAEIGQSRETITLRTPAAFPLHTEEGVYEVRALSAWFEAEARGLAARFDARNGNRVFTERIDAVPRLREQYFPAR